MRRMRDGAVCPVDDLERPDLTRISQQSASRPKRKLDAPDWPYSWAICKPSARIAKT